MEELSSHIAASDPPTARPTDPNSATELSSSSHPQPPLTHLPKSNFSSGFFSSDRIIHDFNKFQNSDSQGGCFSPKSAVREQSNLPCSKLEPNSFDSLEEQSDETPWDSERFPGAEKLVEGERNYKVVERLFVIGMRRFDPDVVVSGVYKCGHLGLVGNSRLRVFQMMAASTKAARGDADVKFGWYGAAPEVVAGVVRHGFGKTSDGVLGVEAHGVGIHLSPPHSPYKSSLLSESDDNGERHIVLCRVITGSSERVEAGSLQYHPSSDEFDSGVDDFVNPKWYIVWSTHMNTHILPEYVVSFRSSNHRPQAGVRRAVSSAAKTPLVAGLSFSKLLAQMERALPHSRKQALEFLYNQHKSGKMAKETFIRHLRFIAGDKLLASAIKRFRGH